MKGADSLCALTFRQKSLNALFICLKAYLKKCQLQAAMHTEILCRYIFKRSICISHQDEKLASEISNRMLFFDLWFKKQIDHENANRLINAISMPYQEHLRHKRLVAKYSSEPEEKIISTLEVTGIRALTKLYDKMTSGFEFTMKLRHGTKTIEKKFDNKEKLVSLVRSPDGNRREFAYKSLLQVYKRTAVCWARFIRILSCNGVTRQF